jgi:hypothetical protein
MTLSRMGLDMLQNARRDGVGCVNALKQLEPRMFGLSSFLDLQTHYVFSGLEFFATWAREVLMWKEPLSKFTCVAVVSSALNKTPVNFSWS